MTILVFGKGGMLAYELEARLGDRAVYLGRDDCDITDAESVYRTVRRVMPATIINAAAFTDVRLAETEQALADAVNGHSLYNIGCSARDIGANVIHYSTDYVFDGQKHLPYTEQDAPNPINAYGKSKLLGENLLAESGCVFLILRTSSLYSSYGLNFVRTILARLESNGNIPVNCNLRMTPASAQDLAFWTVTANAVGLTGIYNATPRGAASWFEFASLIAVNASENGLPVRGTIVPVYNQPDSVNRPAYSVLNASVLFERLKLIIDNCEWRNSVTACVRDIASHSSHA